MTLKNDMAKALIGVRNPAGGTTDLSLTAAQMAAGYFPGGSGVGLIPRRDEVFLSGAFGPGSPANATPIDPAYGGMVLPRRWQYPVGYNLPSAPGATKLIDFRVLEQLADVYDVLRRCIEVRKQEMATLRWEVLPKDQDLQKPGAKRPAEVDGRIKAITAFLECPDPINGVDWADWIKVALEEIFVKDALSIFPHPTWLPGRGVNGSSLFALEILDGKTIKPLLDERGARPLPPNPAYQQFIWGIPRSEMEAQFTSDGAPLGDPNAKTFLAASGGNDSDQPALYYRPYTRRTWTAYGFSNVEQIILNINLALKRQQFHTTFFTDGTVPAGIIGLPEDFAPTAAMVREFEEGWNQLLSGDPTWKHKIKVLPGAGKFEQLKPSYFGTQEVDFDRWLALLTCMGMDVTTMEIGMGPGSNSGLGGKGYGDAEENVTERKSLRPLMEFFSAFFNQILATWFRSPDLELRFLYEQAENALQKAQEDEVLIRSGIKVQNEARVERGLDPYDGVDDQGNKLGDSPIIIASRTIAMLEDINAISKQSAGLNPDGSPQPGPIEVAQAQATARGLGPDRTNEAANPLHDPATGADSKITTASLRKEFEAELSRLTIEEMEALLPTLREPAAPVVVPAPNVTVTVPASQPVVKVAAPVVNLPAPIVIVEAPAVEQLDMRALIKGIGEEFSKRDANRGELEIVYDKYTPTKVVGTRRKKAE